MSYCCGGSGSTDCSVYQETDRDCRTNERTEGKIVGTRRAIWMAIKIINYLSYIQS